MKKIEALIDGKGNIEIKMDGFYGETCQPELEKILSGLDGEGIKVKQRYIKRKAQTQAIKTRQSVMN